MLSFLVTAFIRGEFRDAWIWSDDPEEKQGGCTLEERSSGKADPTSGQENVAALSQVPNEASKADVEADRSRDEDRPQSSSEAKTRKRKSCRSKTNQ